MKNQGPNSCSFVSFINGFKTRCKTAFRTQKVSVNCVAFVRIHWLS